MRELESIAPYGTPGQTIPIRDVYIQRKWIGFYGGVMAYRQNNDADSDLSELSPDYTDEEIRRIWEGNHFATPYLLPELLSIDVGAIRKLDVPLILLEGRHDLNVNSAVCAEWFARVKAPEKQLVWFEHSAHMPMTEEPGEYFLSLVRYARPIAERSGDIAT